ncbi:MAG: hypothetical protein L6416_08250 [Candidatus Omnitrophica bacterium]|nr:hypothetical protein [Candidatus Omnitrophota bacterium]
MISFFKFFMALLLIAIAVFMMICTEYGFECPLPNSGYFKIKWDPQKKKFDLFHWQPRKNIKPLPKKLIMLEGEKKEPRVKKQF